MRCGRHGVRFSNKGGDIDMIAVLKIYRVPPCVRCSTRTDMCVDMEIQVDDDGLARWQCEVCDYVLMWEQYSQLTRPSSLGLSEGSPRREGCDGRA
eukprot:14062999-Heterocapsa_arctica.AAC.1